MKDENGRRQYSPKKVMDTMATYYENLYKIKPTRIHPMHEHVQSQTMQYLIDKNADEEIKNGTTLHPLKGRFWRLSKIKSAGKPLQI